MNQTALIDFASRIFCDRLARPEDAIQVGDSLTVFDDGSGAAICGKTLEVEAVATEGIYLKVADGSLREAAYNLHYPLCPGRWTAFQRQVLEKVYQKQLEFFVLATESGFIGTQGLLKYPDTYQPLSVVYPNQFFWRSTAATAATDFRSINVFQPQFKIVVQMPAAIQLSASANSSPSWRAIATQTIQG